LAGITPKLGTNRLFREKTDPAGGIVDRIENEIKSYEAQQNIRPFRNCIEEPLPKLAWTRTVDGYEEALLSAENAMRRIFASLLAARAGFEAGHPEAVLLESFFAKSALVGFELMTPRFSICWNGRSRLAKPKLSYSLND
jgi:hypothetical protein